MTPSPDWSDGARLGSHSQRLGNLAVAIVLGWAVGARAAIAQVIPPPEATAAPAEAVFMDLLTLPSIYDIGIDYRRDLDRRWPTVENETPSIINLTPPSLWWNRDQIINRWGGYRLAQSWFAFRSDSTQLNIIDVQVDDQYWRALHNPKQWHFAQQYAVLNQFGTTASSYGYQLRFYQQSILVGVYACDFTAVPALNQPVVAEVPVDQLSDLACVADIGPFVVTTDPLLDGGGLFAPP